MKIVLDDVRTVKMVVLGELSSWHVSEEEQKELAEWTLIRRPFTLIELLEEDALQQFQDRHGVVNRSLRIEEISLDHDLGDAGRLPNGKGELTGWSVMLWLIERCEYDELYIPPVVRVHTANTAVYQKMADAARSLANVRIDRMEKQELI